MVGSNTPPHFFFIENSFILIMLGTSDTFPEDYRCSSGTARTCFKNGAHPGMCKQRIFN